VILPPDEAALASLSRLDDRVRGALYEFVSGRAEPAGRDEAAAAVGIGRALAVYHLDKLVEAGLLTATYRRPPGRDGPGAGRPAKLYSRSGREFTVRVPPREYELAARLLVQAVSSDPGGRSRAALADAARQLGTQLGTGRRAAGRAGSEDPRRALEAVLRDHGFEPYEDGDGPVRLRNCPFHQLAEQDPEVVCGMNLELITGVAAGLGASGLHPVLDPRPGQCCVAIHQRTTEDERHGAVPGP
jgi:predicted ArsR family transcriptional regulator